MNTLQKQNQSGFTIIELIVVVIVISLLAAILFLGFNGIRQRATDSTLATELSSTAKQLELEKTAKGAYPSSLNDLPKSQSGDNKVTYRYTGGVDTYCLTAFLNSTAYRINSADKKVVAGACDGHSTADTGGSQDTQTEIVHTQKGAFSQPSTSLQQKQSIPISFDVQPTDFVFILFNADHRTKLISAESSGVQIPERYARSMVASGYQRHFAYSTSGLSGSQTVEMTMCWGWSNCHPDPNGLAIEAAYIIYVIRGMNNPSVSSTYTPYGTQPAFGSTISPQRQAIAKGDVAIYSHLFYGNNLPTPADNSQPAMQWVADSKQTHATATGDLRSLNSYHLIGTEAADVSHSITMPSSGSRYTGSVLFLIKD